MKKVLFGILVGLLVIVVLVTGFGFWLYSGQQTSAKERFFTGLRLPAALVNSNFVPMTEVLARFAITKSSGAAADLSEAESKEQILNKLINDKELDIVAKKYGVEVTQDELEREYQDLVTQLAQGDSASFEKAIQQRAGLNKADFLQKVIRPLALKEQLTLWYNNQESLNPDIYARLNDLKRQIDSGADFAALAKQHSEDDASKEFAGDVGNVALDQLLPEFTTPLSDGAVGSTVLIHSRHGHHLVKIVSRDIADNGQTQVHIQEIFLKPQGFEDWFGRQSGSIVVRKFISFN